MSHIDWYTDNIFSLSSYINLPISIYMWYICDVCISVYMWYVWEYINLYVTYMWCEYMSLFVIYMWYHIYITYRLTYRLLCISHVNWYTDNDISHIDWCTDNVFSPSSLYSNVYIVCVYICIYLTYIAYRRSHVTYELINRQRIFAQHLVSSCIYSVRVYMYISYISRI